VGFSAPGKWGPFGIYLPVTWNGPSFDRTYLSFPSIKLNGFFTKTKEAIFIYNILDSFHYRMNITSFVFAKKPFSLKLGKPRYVQVQSKLGPFHVTGR
jgi:hypothetical protein